MNRVVRDRIASLCACLPLALAVAAVCPRQPPRQGRGWGARQCRRVPPRNGDPSRFSFPRYKTGGRESIPEASHVPVARSRSREGVVGDDRAPCRSSRRPLQPGRADLRRHAKAMAKLADVFELQIVWLGDSAPRSDGTAEWPYCRSDHHHDGPTFVLSHGKSASPESHPAKAGPRVQSKSSRHVTIRRCRGRDE